MARNCILMKNDKRVYRLCRNIGMIHLLKLIIFVLFTLFIYLKPKYIYENHSYEIHVVVQKYPSRLIVFLSATIFSQCLSCVSIVIGVLFLLIWLSVSL